MSKQALMMMVFIAAAALVAWLTVSADKGQPAPPAEPEKPAAPAPLPTVQGSLQPIIGPYQHQFGNAPVGSAISINTNGNNALTPVITPLNV